MEESGFLLDTTEVVDRLAAEFGELDPQELQFLRDLGIVKGRPIGDGLSEKQILLAARVVASLRRRGLTSRPVLRREFDKRAELIEQLIQQASPSSVAPASMSVSADTDYGYFRNGAPPKLSRLVTLTFDGSVPRATLFHRLEEIWPTLKRQGIVRQTRPLSERNAALIRLVCLQAPNASWPERRRLWNQQFPEWSYTDGKRFTTDFYDAAEALTGTRQGLVWFHEPYARMTRDELEQSASTDRKAKRELKKRKDSFEQLMKNLGIDVVFESGVQASETENAESDRGKPDDQS